MISDEVGSQMERDELAAERLAWQQQRLLAQAFIVPLPLTSPLPLTAASASARMTPAPAALALSSGTQPPVRQAHVTPHAFATPRTRVMPVNCPVAVTPSPFPVYQPLSPSFYCDAFNSPAQSPCVEFPHVQTETNAQFLERLDDLEIEF